MYKKINIFLNGAYLCSTNQAKNCKEAKEKIKAKKQIYLARRHNKIIEIKEGDKITAFYDKRYKKESKQ